MAGEEKLVSIHDADAAFDRISRQVLARAYLAKIKSSIEKYRQDRSPERLARGVGYSLLVTLASSLPSSCSGNCTGDCIPFWKPVQVTGPCAPHPVPGVRAGREDLDSNYGYPEYYSSYLYPDHILCLPPPCPGLLPLDAASCCTFAGLHHEAGPYARNGILQQMPNLLFIAVLIFLTRYFLKLMKLFFTGIENRTLTISGFDPDWAKPTYKIARLLVVVFAVIVAYPYIRGLNLLLLRAYLFHRRGVFLGSSSAISNIMAGYMMIYRKAFKVGDRVKIGEFTGDVTDIRLQVTHLRTIKNEEIIVPNSTILTGHVVNYSSFAREHGLILHTTVGSGTKSHGGRWRPCWCRLRNEHRISSGSQSPSCSRNLSAISR